MARTHGVWQRRRDNVLMLLTNGAYAVFFAANPRGFLTNTTTPPQAVWAYSSGCSIRGPLTCATSIHRSPPCWLAPPKRPTSSVLASNNRKRSETAQPWSSLCIAASNGSSFLATHLTAMLFERATWWWWWWWCVMILNYQGKVHEQLFYAIGISLHNTVVVVA